MLPSLQSIFSIPSSATARVEKATSRLLINPDWMMNMDICNSINSDPWKAKSFVKAVKVRLQNKNSKVQFLSLALLETLMKKCDDFVHFQVVERGILSEMVRILRKSKNKEVREKVLALLESWQEAFRGPGGRYPQFYKTYVELKSAGIQFPANKNDFHLNFTHIMPINNRLQIGYEMPTKTGENLDEVIDSLTSHFSLSDLHNIQTVMELFTNMLQAMNPNDHEAIKGEVITDLKNECDISRKKLVQLINSSVNDELLVEALPLNDSLESVLSKYGSLLSRSSLLPERAIDPPKPSLPPPSAPDANLSNKEAEEEEDGFTIIAKRKSIYDSSGVQEVSGNNAEQNNAIVLFSSSTKEEEEDMIDLLLSPTLSAYQSPSLQDLSSNQNQNPISDSLSWEHYLNQPQPLISNEGYDSYNNYIAPWARPIAQSQALIPFSPQQQLQQASYLPSSWSVAEVSSNPFLSSSYVPYPASQPIPSSQRFG